MPLATISPERLYDTVRARGHVELVDVRTPAEFRAIHAPGARLHPLDGLDPRAVVTELDGAVGDPIYVICHTGKRAEAACAKFIAHGIPNVAIVEGGTVAWEAAGLPLERGRSALPLDRQVRTAVGVMVLATTLLGAFVHPGWLVATGFIGAALTVAGLTDLCPLRSLIARMPWNQKVA